MSLFEEATLLDIKIPWTPQVKERPRFANGRVYTPTRTLHAEAAIREAFNDVVSDWTPYDGTCSVVWELANDWVGITLRPHGDYTQRKLRGDVDNYQKILSDALNGVLFVDDRLIVHTEARKL